MALDWNKALCMVVVVVVAVVAVAEVLVRVLEDVVRVRKLVDRIRGVRSLDWKDILQVEQGGRVVRLRLVHGFASVVVVVVDCSAEDNHSLVVVLQS